MSERLHKHTKGWTYVIRSSVQPTSEVWFESRRWWSCIVAVVLMPWVTLASVFLLPGSAVSTEEECVDAIGYQQQHGHSKQIASVTALRWSGAPLSLLTVLLLMMLVAREEAGSKVPET